jgi:hypothetical protein
VSSRRTATRCARSPPGSTSAGTRRGWRRIAGRPLAEWLALLDGEEVCAGPLLSLEEAAAELGTEPALGAPAALREHTDAWRAELA